MDTRMTKREKLLENARAKCDEVHRRFPQCEPLESIERQLDYLLGLVRGDHQDRTRLRDIIVAVQAVREIEPLDPELAKMLFEVQDVADAMRVEAPTGG